jgi:hypothetical protein
MPLKATRAEDSLVWHLVKLPPDSWALGELYLALRIPNKWKLFTAIIRPERKHLRMDSGLGVPRYGGGGYAVSVKSSILNLFSG